MSSNFETKGIGQPSLSFHGEKENNNTSKVLIIYNKKNMIESCLVKFNI